MAVSGCNPIHVMCVLQVFQIRETPSRLVCFFGWMFVVQCDIDHQDIDPACSEKSQLGFDGLFPDQFLDPIQTDMAAFCDSGGLEFGIHEADVGVET